jgi:hypothetical protein
MKRSEKPELKRAKLLNALNEIDEGNNTIFSKAN